MGPQNRVSDKFSGDADAASAGPGTVVLGPQSNHCSIYESTGFPRSNLILAHECFFFFNVGPSLLIVFQSLLL